MPTIQDVDHVLGIIAEWGILCKGVNWVKYEYNPELESLGDLICDELGVAHSRWLKISRKKTLPPKSAKQFEDFKSWLKRQSGEFSRQIESLEKKT